MGDAPGKDKGDREQPGFTATGAEGDISQLIVAASADGIVAVDDQGVIRVCNRAAEELLARPARDLIGAPFGFPVVAGRAAEVELMLPGGGERVVEMRATTATLDGRAPAHRGATRRHPPQAGRTGTPGGSGASECRGGHRRPRTAQPARRDQRPSARAAGPARYDDAVRASPDHRPDRRAHCSSSAARAQAPHRIQYRRGRCPADSRPGAGARNHRRAARGYRGKTGRDPGVMQPGTGCYSRPGRVLHDARQLP